MPTSALTAINLGENRVVSPLDFETAPWITCSNTFGVAVTADATTAPDGSVTADKVTEDGTTGAHQISQTLVNVGSNTYSISCYFKSADRSAVSFGVVGAPGNGVTAFFDLSGALVSGISGQYGLGFAYLGASITAVGNGWYFCKATFSTSVTVNNVVANVCSAPTIWDYQGVVGDGLYIWGMRLNVGTFAGSGFFNPSIDAAPLAIAVNALTAAPLATASPSFDRPALSSFQVIAAAGFSDSVPVFLAPILSLFLFASPLAVTAPQVGVPNALNLVPVSLSAGAPTFQFLSVEIDGQEGGYTSGGDPNLQIEAAVPTVGSVPVIATPGPDLSIRYHTYGVEYIPGVSVRTFFDGVLQATFSSNIPTASLSMMIDLRMAQNAVGWHSNVSDSTPDGLRLSVSGVQVYGTGSSLGLGVPTLTPFNALTATGISLSPPIIVSPPPSLIARGLAGAAPVLGSPNAIGSVAVVLAVHGPTIGQPQILLAGEIGAASLQVTPVLAPATLGQVDVLSATVLAIGVPTIGVAALASISHGIALPVAVGALTLDRPTVGQTDVLSASAASAGPPALAPAPVHLLQGLHSTSVSVGLPSLDSPFVTLLPPPIAQTQNLTAADFIGHVVLDRPNMVAALPGSLVVSSPEFEVPFFEFFWAAGTIPIRVTEPAVIPVTIGARPTASVVLPQ